MAPWSSCQNRGNVICHCLQYHLLTNDRRDMFFSQALIFFFLKNYTLKDSENPDFRHFPLWGNEKIRKSEKIRKTFNLWELANWSTPNESSSPETHKGLQLFDTTNIVDSYGCCSEVSKIRCYWEFTPCIPLLPHVLVNTWSRGLYGI